MRQGAVQSSTLSSYAALSRWRSVSLCLAFLAGGSEARAEVGQKVRLSWVPRPGASTCIAQPALEARIAARLGRAAFERDVPRSVEAYVAREDHAWHARIQVRDVSTGKEASREFANESESCAALEAAVALAIALVIDPDAPMSTPRADTSAPPPSRDAVVRPVPRP